MVSLQKRNLQKRDNNFKGPACGGEARSRCMLACSLKKKKIWKLRRQDENKETKAFVRLFYLFILPELFLSILSSGLNCCGFASLVFLKLEPTAFSLIPQVADLLFLCVCSCFFITKKYKARNVKAPHGAGSATRHPHKFTRTPKVLACVLPSSSYPEHREAEPGAHALRAAPSP